jgi:hypothetical protein
MGVIIISPSLGMNTMGQKKQQRSCQSREVSRIFSIIMFQKMLSSEDWEFSLSTEFKKECNHGSYFCRGAWGTHLEERNDCFVFFLFYLEFTGGYGKTNCQAGAKVRE